MRTASAGGSWPSERKRRTDRRNLVATFSAHMTWVHLLKVIAFGVLGVALVDYVPLMAAMVVGSSLGGWSGSKVLNRVPERGFRVVFKVLLTLLALRLLWQAAQSNGILRSVGL